MTLGLGRVLPSETGAYLYVCLVDPDRFLDSTFGHPAREPGNRWAFWYYKPAPLPRTLALDTRTVLALSEADSALGHLQGLGHLIRDPELLLGPYLTREAIASSRIEGTETSADSSGRVHGAF